MDEGIIVIIMTAFGTIESTVKTIKTEPLPVSKASEYGRASGYNSKGLDYQALNEKVEYLSNELKKIFI